MREILFKLGLLGFSSLLPLVIFCGAIEIRSCVHNTEFFGPSHPAMDYGHSTVIGSSCMGFLVPVVTSA